MPRANTPRPVGYLLSGSGAAWRRRGDAEFGALRQGGCGWYCQSASGPGRGKIVGLDLDRRELDRGTASGQRTMRARAMFAREGESRLREIPCRERIIEA